MQELFVVWMTTTGAFGFKAANNIDSACDLKKEKRGAVFQIKDPGMRYAIFCQTPVCDFPGWVTVPINCLWVDAKKEDIPAHWEIELNQEL